MSFDSDTPATEHRMEPIDRDGQTETVSLSEAKEALGQALSAEEFTAVINGLARRSIVDDAPDPGELAKLYGRRRNR